MGKTKPDCKTCIYRAENRIWKCNYETVTGHTRLAVPAKRCKHYVKGKMVKTSPFDLMEKLRRAENAEKTKKPGQPGKYDWALAKQLYDAGKNDAEISRELGCTANTVRLWRGRNKLASHAPKGFPPKPQKYDWEKGRALYDAGKNDAEIARELGCTDHAVRNWRVRRQLPANRAPGFLRKEETT